METTIKLKTKDKKIIEGTLKHAGDDDKVIVFVHGLTDHKNTHLFFNGSKFFAKKGFSSFRFDLYNWGEDRRKLSESSLTTHAQDINQVIDYFKKKKYKKIFLVGHSIGCPSILFANASKANAIVFWDPATNNSWYKDETVFVKQINKYYGRNAGDIVLSKKLIDEETNIDFQELITKVNSPLKIIAAAKGILVKPSKSYFKKANNPKSLTIIPGATHSFDEEGKEEELFDETLKWIAKYCS